mmetsp:Transcript_48952/g.124672  ORF Transcript_48952/g.124672 Transcript_48952/m.124672 type:complete len:471 (-) Transcript_48952:83-1495(-)
MGSDTERDGGAIPSLEDLLANLDRLDREDLHGVEPSCESAATASRTAVGEVMDFGLASGASFDSRHVGGNAAYETDMFTAQDRRRAYEERRAFEERCRRSREEAEALAADAERRRAESLSEARETICMAAEEEAERRRRAMKSAEEKEVATRARLTKEMVKRHRDKETAKETAQLERVRRRQRRAAEKEERRAKREADRMVKMAENGYAFGPTGWVKLDWMAGDEKAELASSATPSDEETTSSAEGEEEEEDSRAVELEVDDSPDDIVDQQPLADHSELQDVVPIDELLARIDRSERDAWETAPAPPALEDMLTVISAEMKRDEDRQNEESIKQAFTDIGKVQEGDDEGAPAVLQLAKERRPDVDWKGTVRSESALKPFNDVDEAKQDGENSFEMRLARSAEIQAKMQAARNRMSVVRWQQPRGRRAPTGGAQHDLPAGYSGGGVSSSSSATAAAVRMDSWSLGEALNVD